MMAIQDGPPCALSGALEFSSKRAAHEKERESARVRVFVCRSAGRLPEKTNRPFARLVSDPFASFRALIWTPPKSFLKVQLSRPSLAGREPAGLALVRSFKLMRHTNGRRRIDSRSSFVVAAELSRRRPRDRVFAPLLQFASPPHWNCLRADRWSRTCFPPA